MQLRTVVQVVPERLAVVLVLCAAAWSGLVAQQPARTALPPGSVMGTVASMRTTRGVPSADVRLLYVDSVGGSIDPATGMGELFVDSTKSRIAISDSAGAFVVRRMAPGHYLLNVRRIGFLPFEGMLTIDTAIVEMELAMEQVMAVLPTIRITASGNNRVLKRLDDVGFTSRRRITSAQNFDRGQILDQRVDRVTDVLTRNGIGPTAIIMIDKIETDWETLRNYPIDLVIGIEIYRRRTSLPVEFDRTRQFTTALDEGRVTNGNAGGSGGIAQATVLIWTYVP